MTVKKKSYHMTSGDFRKWGHAMVDWVADYRERVESFPVLSRVRPGEIRAKLPARAPEHPESFERIIEDLDEIILPGITHWQSPNFYAYFPANSSEPAVLGELLSAGLGIQGMLWTTSPACTELETHVLDWLVDIMQLPDGFKSSSSGGGVIQDSASAASLCSLLAARERATGFESNTRGASGTNLIAHASKHAHSSVDKATRIAGIGSDQLRLVDVDATHALIPESLRDVMEKDRRAGLIPFYVAATCGTTSSHAMDPIRKIGEICKDHGAWLHVDAAMAGTAAICPEYRYLQDGLELADSYCFNPHKWMFVSFDCTAFYVTDRQSLLRTLTNLPEYLRNNPTESGAVIDYRDWHVPLGRRFRALKLWFVLRHYGVEGLQHHIREHVALAQAFASWVDAHPSFQVVAPHPLNLVCFRYVGSDQQNETAVERA